MPKSDFDFDNVVTVKERASKTMPITSSITLMLTPEQNEIYKANKDKDDPLFYIGFIPPNQITSYFCEKCGEQEGALNARVNIRDTVFDKHSANIGYYCEKDHLVYHYVTLKDLDIIPVDLIIMDETGDYKKPTPEAIEEIMKRIEEDAKEGNPAELESSVEREYDLKLARKWAEKIGYEIPQERIGSLEETRKKAYIEKFHKELPEFLKDIFEFDLYSFSLIDDHDGFTCYWESGLGEKIDELFKMLPHLNPVRLDSETQIGVIKILHLYNLMFVKKRDYLQGEKEELEKKIEEIEKEITGSKSFVIEYENKLGLTKEQRKKAEEEARSASF